MARDLGDTIGSALGTVARSATDAVSRDGHGGTPRRSGSGPLSGARGVAAGVALAAAAPFAAKEAGKAVRHAVSKRIGDPLEAARNAKGGVVEKATEGAKGVVRGVVERRLDQAGGVPGAMKEAGKQMLTGGGGGGGGGKGTPGVGKGRRMPVQQAVEVAVPLEVAYNQWTQFSEWPEFMHRVMQVTQEDDCTVSFKVKLWGMSKQFTAEIVEQRPDERIQWNTTDGVTHAGAVTFHALGPRLTRIQVSLDVQPGGLVEKAARGMRHVKRAVRADLARFKAFIEMQEVESGAWRGTIHDGELVEPHDESYDDERDYADVDDIDEPDSSHAAPSSAATDEAYAEDEDDEDVEADASDEDEDDEDVETDEDEDDDEDVEADASDEDEEEEEERAPAPSRARRRGGAASRRTRRRSNGEHARRGAAGRRPRRRRAGARSGG